MIYTTRFSDVTIWDAPPGAPPRSSGDSLDTGKAEQLLQGFFCLPAGEHREIDYHDIDESYFVTRGKGYGLIWTNGEDKEPERWEIEPGVSTFVPAWARHQLWNTGKEDIWLVYFFPSHPKVGGKLHSHPFSPKTWGKRTSTPPDAWYPTKSKSKK
ncbi:MAG: cupin domain-containing protein [Dehalococcoidales bacterium]|nr:cupin domain-containing protein [Dehalococcoidales bacterium]